MLGLPLSSTSSVLLLSEEVPHHNTHSNLCRAPFHKLTPIYIVRQCTCFTLIEFCDQIDFKTKIPKTYPLFQFRGVPPNAPQPNIQNTLTFSYKHPPKHCLKSSTIETKFDDFFSIISINFNKKCQTHH